MPEGEESAGGDAPDAPDAPGESQFVVWAAIVGNAGIAVSKFAAAAFTGSSAMLSEGIHSSVDTANDALLLLGIRRSKRPADDTHPFGHGKELYFWTLLVAVFIFGVGGGMGVYEGVTHLIDPEPIGDPTWGYVVLGVAAVLEGATWGIALRNFLKHKPPGRGVVRAIRRSKDPTVFTVLFEDTAALIGIALAAAGLFFGHLWDNPYLDGAASVGIGLVLAAVAAWLAWESKGLLVGERADAAEVRRIRDVAESDPDVASARPPLTMHLGPEQVLVALDVEFRDGLSADGVEAAVRRMESAIKRAVPAASHIYVEARSLRPGRRE